MRPFKLKGPLVVKFPERSPANNVRAPHASALKASAVAAWAKGGAQHGALQKPSLQTRGVRSARSNCSSDSLFTLHSCSAALLSACAAESGSSHTPRAKRSRRRLFPRHFNSPSTES